MIPGRYIKWDSYRLFLYTVACFRSLGSIRWVVKLQIVVLCCASALLMMIFEADRLPPRYYPHIAPRWETSRQISWTYRQTNRQTDATKFIISLLPKAMQSAKIRVCMQVATVIVVKLPFHVNWPPPPLTWIGLLHESSKTFITTLI